MNVIVAKEDVPTRTLGNTRMKRKRKKRKQNNGKCRIDISTYMGTDVEIHHSNVTVEDDTRIVVPTAAAFF